MATLAASGRITTAEVDEEIERLRARWRPGETDAELVDLVLGAAADRLDRFDRAQLEAVLRTCSVSASLSAAGRTLFAESRKRRGSVNDADRLRKYLARYDLDWDTVRERVR